MSRQADRVQPSLLLVALLTAIALVAAACGSSDDEPEASTTTTAGGASTTTAPVETTEVEATTTTAADGEAAAACMADVDLMTEGTLTVRTYSPLEGEDLDGQVAYEGAVLYAVADELGFSAEDVQVEIVAAAGTDADFIIAGETPFDIGVSNISISEERAEVVDFASTYDVEWVVVGPEDSVAAGATTTADLADARLGVFFETGSIVYGATGEYVAAAIEPSTEPVDYGILWDDQAELQTALDDGTIDAVIIDLPSASYLLDENGSGIENATTVARLPPVTGTIEQIGMVIEKDSDLVTCVDLALASLADDGTIEDLQNEHLYDGGILLLDA